MLILIACTERVAPPPAKPAPKPVEAPVLTDRTRYVLERGPYGPQATIVTTFKPDRTVYVMNCNGAMTHGLQRLEGGRWVDAWIAEINGCFSTPIVIPAGGQHVATMTPVSRAETWTIQPGTYRAVWHNVLTSFDAKAAPGRPMGEDLPLEQRVSAPFVIDAR
jgi:hypothetical protein